MASRIAHRRWMLVLACLWGLALPAKAEPPSPPAHIGAASWLAGIWVGEGLGGQVEESWSAPRGGQMIGHFSLVRNGAPVFYELMLLDEQAGGLRLRVKHFNPDFTGWEEKDGWHSFEPRAAAPGELLFDGLSLRLEGGQLVATVTLRDRASGTVQDRVLRFQRAPH